MTRRSMSGDQPHFFRYLNFDWAIGADHTAYGDVSVGFPASEAFARSTPTLDLSMHVFRTPAVADFTIESRLVKIGRRSITGESWFTATGERDPYALCVATFFSVGDPLPEGWQAPTADDPRFFPHASLDEAIDEKVGSRRGRPARSSSSGARSFPTERPSRVGSSPCSRSGRVNRPFPTT